MELLADIGKFTHIWIVVGTVVALVVAHGIADRW